MSKPQAITSDQGIPVHPGDPEKAEVAQPREPYLPSNFWDYYAPILIAAFPTSVFFLMGLIIGDLNQSSEGVASWKFTAIGILQTIGIVAMAILILSRYEFGKKQLFARTKGTPPFWRRFLLKSSIVSILFFDLFTNVGAFAGSGLLMIAAVPVFVVYVYCIRKAFAGI